MDPIVMAAGTALVGAMATDAWQHARARVIEWWREIRPDQAEAVGAALAEVHTQVTVARQTDDAVLEEGLVTDWQVRLQVLLRANPALASELRQLLDKDLTPVLPAEEQSAVTSLVMKASASGRGRVYQAARDQHITER